MRKLPDARALDVRVWRVRPAQPAKGHIDRWIDGWVHAWNEQTSDKQAFDYFLGAPWEQSAMLYHSLYRYPDKDREFLARQLKALADAIYAATARWM